MLLWESSLLGGDATFCVTMATFDAMASWNTSCTVGDFVYNICMWACLLSGRCGSLIVQTLWGLCISIFTFTSQANQCMAKHSEFICKQPSVCHVKLWLKRILCSQLLPFCPALEDIVKSMSQRLHHRTSLLHPSLANYSGTSLIWTPSGRKNTSWWVRCPYFMREVHSSCHTHMHH